MRAPAASAKPPGCCRTVQNGLRVARLRGRRGAPVSDSVAAAERHSSSSTRALSSGLCKLASTEARACGTRYQSRRLQVLRGGGLLSSRRLMRSRPQIPSAAQRAPQPPWSPAAAQRSALIGLGTEERHRLLQLRRLSRPPARSPRVRPWRPPRWGMKRGAALVTIRLFPRIRDPCG